MKSLHKYDLALLKKYDYLIGIDEVGRGCLAGPLVVCGIIMKYDNLLEEVNDSKKLSRKKREQFNDDILNNCLEYVIVEVDIKTVDEKNIYQATKLAMNEIATKLNKHNSLILSDAMPLDIDNNLAIKKGDETSYAIACASIIAKVYRDKLMCLLAQEYPQYDFENNMGYGTKKHLEALEKHGYLEDIHRKSFEPIKSMCNKQIKFEL
ncbi:ribonuclease HII [Erysipelotrichaceae bacterium OttesenSCG-928-M19]|nr:ribonuclease HII [Erysipelotrichaceae bacterium OttesenSCG-928-M19]